MEEEKNETKFVAFVLGCDLVAVLNVKNEIVQSSSKNEIKHVKIMATTKEGYAIVDYTIPQEPVSVLDLLDVAEISLLPQSKVSRIENNAFMDLHYIVDDCIIKEDGVDIACLIQEKKNKSQIVDDNENQLILKRTSNHSEEHPASDKYHNDSSCDFIFYEEDSVEMEISPDIFIGYFNPDESN